jgi:hypothetical protein
MNPLLRTSKAPLQFGWIVLKGDIYALANMRFLEFLLRSKVKDDQMSHILKHIIGDSERGILEGQFLLK